jgi:hypothetical protein
MVNTSKPKNNNLNLYCSQTNAVKFIDVGGFARRMKATLH